MELDLKRLVGREPGLTTVKNKIDFTKLGNNISMDDLADKPNYNIFLLGEKVANQHFQVQWVTCSLLPMQTQLV